MNTIKKSVDNLKTNVKNLHDEALNVSENMVEASLTTGAKWQKIMAKAMTEGVVLFGKQQDLVISTLEELKGQYRSGNKRFRHLIGLDMPKAPQAKKVAKPKKTVKKDTGRTIKVESPAPKEKASSKSDITKNDLKTIDGIGPKMESLLNQAGITTFDQLAKTDVKDLTAILENAGSSSKLHNPSSWKQQAKAAQ